MIFKIASYLSSLTLDVLNCLEKTQKLKRPEHRAKIRILIHTQELCGSPC